MAKMKNVLPSFDHSRRRFFRKNQCGMNFATLIVDRYYFSLFELLRKEGTKWKKLYTLEYYR